MYCGTNRWAYLQEKTTLPPNFIQKRGELTFEGGPIFKGGSIFERLWYVGVYLREFMLFVSCIACSAMYLAKYMYIHLSFHNFIGFL